MDNLVTSKSNFRLATLLLFATVLLGINIWGYDLWPADEPRFGQVAREMMRSGDYLAPHVNGRPYREKPPLLFWSIAAASLPFGDVTSASARIPSLIAALSTLVCTFVLAAKLFDGRIALWSIVVLATSTRFWWQARTVQIDMLLTACLTLALLLFWLWFQNGKTSYLVGFYACIGAAVYAKGPPGMVFPLLLILTFFWKDQPGRKRTHWVLGFLGVIMCIVAWLIPARMSVAGSESGALQGDMGSNLFRQTIGRFFLGVSHAQPPWYYVETLAVDLFPWTLILPFTFVYLWKHRGESLELNFLLRWIIPAFCFFSLSFGKRALYLLPLFPAISIIVACSITEMLDTNASTWRRRVVGLWSGLMAVFAVAPFVILLTDYREAWTNNLLIVSGAAALCSIHAGFVALRSQGKSLPSLLAGHIALLEILAALIVFPLVNPYKSAREFCEPVRRLSHAEVPFQLYSVGFSREAYIFYADAFHQPLLAELLPMTNADPQDLFASAKIQSRLRKQVSNAAAKVVLESIKSITDGERAHLSAAVKDALASSDVGAGIAADFETAIMKETQVLATDPEQPTFVFIREDDLRWLYPIQPDLQAYTVVHAASVGARDVVLLANGPALRLLEAHPPRP